MAPGPSVLPLSTVMTSCASAGLVKSTHAPEASCIRRTAKLPKSRQPADDPCAVAARPRTSSSRDCSSASLTSAESPPIQSEREAGCCGAACCGAAAGSDTTLVPMLRELVARWTSQVPARPGGPHSLPHDPPTHFLRIQAQRTVVHDSRHHRLPARR